MCVCERERECVREREVEQLTCLEIVRIAQEDSFAIGNGGPDGFIHGDVIIEEEKEKKGERARDKERERERERETDRERGSETERESEIERERVNNSLVWK